MYDWVFMCVNVCVCLCVPVCMYACVCVYLCVRVRARVWARVCVRERERETDRQTDGQRQRERQRQRDREYRWIAFNIICSSLNMFYSPSPSRSPPPLLPQSNPHTLHPNVFVYRFSFYNTDKWLDWQQYLGVWARLPLWHILCATCLSQGNKGVSHCRVSSQVKRTWLYIF